MEYFSRARVRIDSNGGFSNGVSACQTWARADLMAGAGSFRFVTNSSWARLAR